MSISQVYLPSPWRKTRSPLQGLISCFQWIPSLKLQAYQTMVKIGSKAWNLDLEVYKPYLKSQYKGAHSHVFPFRYLLEKYAPFMKVVMKFFTCEGIFSRIYQYHIRLLMHFTAAKPLNLYRSLTKMSKRVQLKGKVHYPNLFHHSLIKVIVLHQLKDKNMTWETLTKATLKTHITTSPS